MSNWATYCDQENFRYLLSRKKSGCSAAFKERLDIIYITAKGEYTYDSPTEEISHVFAYSDKMFSCCRENRGGFVMAKRN